MILMDSIKKFLTSIWRPHAFSKFTEAGSRLLMIAVNDLLMKPNASATVRQTENAINFATASTSCYLRTL